MHAEKLAEAKKVIAGCRRDSGFHASSQRYPELWIRDFSYSLPQILDLGYRKEARAHLDAFVRLQRETGQIPTVITTCLRGIFNQRFHFWTSDSEPLFVIGALTYSKITGDGFASENSRSIAAAVDFIERRLDSDGLLPGMDWRDAMPNYYGKRLLANQMQLVDMYVLLGQQEKARSMADKTNELFYSREKGFYADYTYRRGYGLEREFHFDSLGNSLAILNGTARKVAPEELLRGFATARTRYGHADITPPYRIERLRLLNSIQTINAFVRDGAIFRNSQYDYQNDAVWPFIEAIAIRALIAVGAGEEAKAAAEKVLGRAGMNEYYSALTGEPRGSDGQLWTGAAVISACESLSSLKR